MQQMELSTDTPRRTSLACIAFVPEAMPLMAPGVGETLGQILIGHDDRNSSCYFVNAATCPDCNGGMVRLGSCFSCPSCGYQSCG
ncbi:MAG TPA: hypothetical protein VN285_10200 [Candidatus Deferrimicrobium sp.]|nr:hypothetical protein [Candidatus Deferrimicrobium sp.]